MTGPPYHYVRIISIFFTYTGSYYPGRNRKMLFKKSRKLKQNKLVRFTVYRRLNLLYLALLLPRPVYLLMRLLRPFYEKRENFLNRTWRYGLLTFGGGLTPPKEMEAMRWGAKALRDSMARALKAQKKNEPVVWVEWILSAELIEAFDVASFNTETLNIFGNTYGEAYPPMLIAAAEEQGIPVENCSAVKLSVGSFLLKQIPDPTLFVAASHPCDSSISIYQALEYLTGAPTFSFDTPYWKDDESYRYFEENMWNCVDFLEEHLQKAIDWGKLKDVLERVNEINHYLGEICEMNRAVPCPGTMISLLYFWVIREVAIRQQEAVDLARGLYEVTRKRFDRGIGTVKNERIRIIMWFPPIGFFTYIFKWMEEEFGAVVVADFIGHISTFPIDTSRPETMIRGLAKTQMHLGMGRQCHGPSEFLTEELGRLIEEYSADCVLFMGHNGCKHGWAALKIIRDYLAERNMPALYLNLDIMDNRHTSEEELRDQIRTFFISNGWA